MDPARPSNPAARPSALYRPPDGLKPYRAVHMPGEFSYDDYRDLADRQRLTAGLLLFVIVSLAALVALLAARGVLELPGVNRG